MSVEVFNHPGRLEEMVKAKAFWTWLSRRRRFISSFHETFNSSSNVYQLGGLVKPVIVHSS